MKSNTSIEYIEENGLTCKPLPIIETTETSANKFPIKSAIFHNESGFTESTITYNSTTYTPTHIKQEVFEDSNGSISCLQYVSILVSNVMPIHYIRYLYKSSTSTSTTFTSYGSWNGVIEGSSVIAQRLTTGTIGDNSTPIFIANGYANPCSGIYHENLIMNPDFTINQRGVVNYTTTSSTYAYDRWKFVASTSMCYTAPNTGSGAPLCIMATGYACSVYQYLEQALDLNTTYTITLKTGTNTITGSFTTPTALPSATTNYFNKSSSALTLSVGYNTVYGYWFVQIYLDGTSAAQSVSLKYIKLEKGSVSTIFTPPNPTTELLKCQRYHVCYTGNGTFIGTGFASDTLTALIQVALPTQLRATPTITLSGVYCASSNHLASSALSVLYKGNTSFNGNSVKFEVGGSGLTKGETCMLQIRTSSGYVSFDAELC